MDMAAVNNIHITRSLHHSLCAVVAISIAMSSLCLTRSVYAVPALQIDTRAEAKVAASDNVYLTEDNELTDLILPKMNWNTPCEIEEIDRLIWKKIEIEEIKRDASEKLNTYRDTVKYFQSLISRTNTYFLSDYVINELDGYVTEEEYKEFCQRLIILEGACYDKGLDIHEISQEVAVPFIEAIGNVTCPNCKHKF